MSIRDQEGSSAEMLAAAFNSLRSGATDDEERVEATQVLDMKQQAELMALRATQGSKLKRADKRITVMFTDLVGSTQYYERYGDVKGREKVLTHNALLFPIVQQNGGTIVKTIGDAIMAYFPTEEESLRAAAAMMQALHNSNRSIADKDHQIHIRIALNAGIAIAQQGDIYGDVVNVAARIEHKAEADEILMSASVAEMCRAWPIEAAGSATFKGKSEAITLFRLKWQGMKDVDIPRAPDGIPERFRLRGLLSRGSMGPLFSGTDANTDDKIVIKSLWEALAKDAEMRRSFVLSARNSALLKHPSVVRILEHSSGDAVQPFFVAEHVEGASLSSLVTKAGPLDPREAALCIHALGGIVAQAHASGLFHGNLTPDCVLVTPEGELKLTGFGSGALIALAVKRGGSPPGTASFLAPELILGGASNDKGDVYSLAALLYYLVSGREPFEDAESLAGTLVVASGNHVPLKKVRPDVPDSLVAVVQKSMSLIARARPQDVGALLSELDRFTKANADDLKRALKKRFQRLSYAPQPAPHVPKIEAATEDSFEETIPVIFTSAIDELKKHPLVIASSLGALLTFFLLGFWIGNVTSNGPTASDVKTQSEKPIARVVPSPVIDPDALQTLITQARNSDVDALVIRQGGKIITEWRKTAEATPVALGSLSELATSLAVGRLLTSGKLRSVDQLVFELFPEWQQGKKQNITLRQLLEHTSGLSDEGPSEPVDVVRLALAAEVVDEPGTKRKHNAKAFNLLAGVIERASKKKLDVFLDEELLRPLRLTQGRFRRDRADNPLAATGLELAPASFAQLAELVVVPGALIDDDWRQTMTTAGNTDKRHGFGINLVGEDGVFIDEALYEKWYDADVSSDSLQRLTPLVGRVFVGQTNYQRALERALGGYFARQSFLKELGRLGLDQARVLGATTSLYTGLDTQNHALAIVPEARIVAVAFSSNRGAEEFMSQFAERVRGLSITGATTPSLATPESKTDVKAEGKTAAKTEVKTEAPAVPSPAPANAQPPKAQAASQPAE